MTLLFHHPQLSIIQQRLGHCAQVMRGPDQFLVAVHQAADDQVAHVTHQFGGLFAGVLAGDAGFDAEQRVSVVFALVEAGLADCGGFCCVVGGHCFVSLDSGLPGLACSRARPLPQVLCSA